MPAGLEVLSVARIRQIWQGLQDVRTIPQTLVWLNRTRVVPALDAEIIGRYVGTTILADLVADDARASVIEAGRFQFERYVQPNIKHGRAFSQAQLAQLDTINRSGDVSGDNGIVGNYINNEQAQLMNGIDQRREALIVAMLIDAFSYNKLGIQINGATWGMPSDLKVTPTNPWTDAVNGTPINDILTLKRTAQVRYGQTFDRVTMSLSVLNLIVQTAEFQTRARFVLMPGMSIAQLPLNNTSYAQNIVGNLMGIDVELYDARAWAQATDGTITSSPYLPLNKVLLTNSADDNDPNAWDFSNGVVTESLVASMANTNMIGRFAGPTYGPVGYTTAPPDLNPPNLTMWGVARGWPRKHRLQSSAVLTVGTVTDLVSTSVPFPS